jgi:hypothetical protein
MFTFVLFLRNDSQTRACAFGAEQFRREVNARQIKPHVCERHGRCLSRRSCYWLIHPGRNGAHYRVYVKAVDFMKNAPNLESNHNAAIRAEIGNRLRVLLPKEQPSPSPRIQHSLDCLNALDATETDLAIGGISWRPLSLGGN